MRKATLALAYLLWAAFGFAHGFHWLVLWYRSRRLQQEQEQQLQQQYQSHHELPPHPRARGVNFQPLVGSSGYPPAVQDTEGFGLSDSFELAGHPGGAGNQNGSSQQLRLFGHFLFYALSHAGFWIFRQTMLPYHRRCAGGKGMNPRCLFREQHPYYRAAYTIHIVLMLFVFFHWALDFFALPFWCRQLEAGRKVTETWVYPVVCLATLAIGLLYIYEWHPDHL